MSALAWWEGNSTFPGAGQAIVKERQQQGAAWSTSAWERCWPERPSICDRHPTWEPGGGTQGDMGTQKVLLPTPQLQPSAPKLERKIKRYYHTECHSSTVFLKNIHTLGSILRWENVC